jgi:hypothetical protein
MQVYGNRWASLDDTGWSIQSKSIDLRAASVTISAGWARSSTWGEGHPHRAQWLGGRGRHHLQRHSRRQLDADSLRSAADRLRVTAGVAAW